MLLSAAEGLTSFINKMVGKFSLVVALSADWPVHLKTHWQRYADWCLKRLGSDQLLRRNLVARLCFGLALWT